MEDRISSNDRALVLFSGGQDSSVCLAWSLDRFSYVETIGFDYGQKHKIELTIRDEFRDTIRKDFPNWRYKLGEDHLLNLELLGQISETSLTKDIQFEMSSNDLPNTFVPGRNLIFLTFAAAVAYRRGIKHIVTGVCETDYSGYPDCRDDTIKAMQIAIGLGMDKRFVFHTPLMWLDKAATWEMTQNLGGSDFVELVKYKTHTCYHGDRVNYYEWGFGCGECPACKLRMQGFKNWKSKN